MESPIIPYSTLFTLFCILLVVILYKAKRQSKSSKNLPPGPPKLPIIGNLHQIVGSLPHRSLRDLAKKYGPIMHLQLGEISNVVISSTEMAKEIYRTHDVTFSNRPQLIVTDVMSYGGKSIGFSSYGNYWRHLRKICTIELFTVKRVQSFRFIREEEVWELVKYISANEGSVVNLSEKIFSLANTVTARAAFGKKSKDQQAFLETQKQIVKLLIGLSIADLFPSVKLLQYLTGMRAKVAKVHKENDRIMENIIKDYKEASKTNEEHAEDNLLDVLFKIQEREDQDFLKDLDDIKAVVLGIFMGGSETTSTTLEWTMAELLRNPKVMAKAQAEVRSVYKEKGYVDESELHKLKYMKSVIKETLRLHPPGPLLIPRENSEGCVINGYEIPAKTKIMVNAWAIGRDPKCWTEPEVFQPERFLDNPIDFRGANLEFIPFGSGRRVCPGIQFAIPNMELPLSNFLYHFDWKLPNGLKNEEIDMSESLGLGVRIKNKLNLIPTRYHP